MLKKSASFVLASLRGSTYRSVRLASSLAAALLDGLFEHPADLSDPASPLIEVKLALHFQSIRTFTRLLRVTEEGVKRCQLLTRSQVRDSNV